MIYSSKAGEGGRIGPMALLEQIHLKSNLIRCCPVPVGIGFSFVIQSR